MGQRESKEAPPGGVVGKERINWRKFEIMGDVVVGIQRAQGTPYPAWQKCEEVRSLILDVKISKDDDVSSCSGSAIIEANENRNFTSAVRISRLRVRTRRAALQSGSRSGDQTTPRIYTTPYALRLQKRLASSAARTHHTSTSQPTYSTSLIDTRPQLGRVLLLLSVSLHDTTRHHRWRCFLCIPGEQASALT
jgi:hypothetical protein